MSDLTTLHLEGHVKAVKNPKPKKATKPATDDGRGIPTVEVVAAPVVTPKAKGKFATDLARAIAANAKLPTAAKAIENAKEDTRVETMPAVETAEPVAVEAPVAKKPPVPKKKPVTAEPVTEPAPAPVATSETPKPKPLGKSAVATLAALSEKGKLTRTQIAEAIGIGSGFTSLLGHIDPAKREPQSLSARGLIEPEVVEADGKKTTYWTITDAGKKALAEATKK